jgi:phosphate transport system substrate-binding protein
MNRFLGVFAAVALVAGVVGCSKAGGASSSESLSITVSGSTSVNPLMEQLKEEYEKINGNVKIMISATGSGDGIRNASTGIYDLGMSSRDLTAVERGSDLVAVVIALDGIAVIVNNANPVENLSISQIKDIYTGAITQWEQLGGDAGGKTGAIAVISRESGSGTRGAFEEILGFQDQLVASASTINSTGAIKAAVNSNVDAIGYISMGSLDDTSKAVAIDGVEAVTENVKASTYSIARPFILLHQRSTPVNAQTQAFLDWILGSEGQSIVQRSWISIQ